LFGRFGDMGDEDGQAAGFGTDAARPRPAHRMAQAPGKDGRPQIMVRVTFNSPYVDKNWPAPMPNILLE
jgi:hypothetical protein